MQPLLKLIVILQWIVIVMPAYSNITPVVTNARENAPAKQIITLGILRYGQAPEKQKSPWDLTLEKLNSHPQYTFKALFLTQQELENKLENDEIDFVISSAFHYLKLEKQYGIQRLLSRSIYYSGDYISLQAISVYVDKMNAALLSIKELKGKHIGLIDTYALIEKDFIKAFFHQHQLDFDQDILVTHFSSYSDLLGALKDGRIDAVLVKSGLDNILQTDEQQNLNLLTPHQDWKIPFYHSSDLIPEWFLAKAWFTNSQLANQVVSILLHQMQAANLTEQFQWNTPESYYTLLKLFPSLQPDTDQTDIVTPLDEIFVHIEYWIALTVSSVLLLFFVLLLLSSWKLNKRIKNSKQDLELEIKERHLAQEIAMQHQEELAHVARLNTMGEMASGLAHELNQPLSAIYTYIHGCIRRIRLNNDDPESILEALELTAQQANRASEIIRRLRSFVKKGETHKTYSDINHVVSEVCDLLGNQIKNKNIQLIFQFEDKLPPVLIDIIQIEQVLINLLKNATETTPDDRELIISISTRKFENKYVKLCVVDNGHGINEEQLKRIFDPFYTTKHNGMGMGLSISSSIIESHDGKLYAKNNPDKGAKFCFTLPITAEKSGILVND